MQVSALISLLCIAGTLAASHYETVPGYRCPAEDIKKGCFGPKDCLYANPKDDKSYIECNDAGIAFLIFCPSDLVWNDEQKYCDRVENVPIHKPNFDCPEADIAETGCMGPKDCLYPHPSDCSKFIHCEVNADGRTGRPTAKDCPAGLQWNNKEKICDWPSHSECKPECKDPVEPKPFVCLTQDIASTQCLGPKDCLYEHPNDCTLFIHCEVNADGRTGRPTVKNCPAGLLWNDELKICDWPWNSKCVEDIPCPDPEPPRPNPPDNFVCNPQDIAITGCRGPKDCLYPFPADCSKFIHCEVNADHKTGRPVVKDCPAGLQWNDNKKECDWPWDSTCHGNNKPDVDDECQKPPAFVCPRADIIQGCLGPKDCLYPYNKDCSKFIHCEVNADGETGRPTVKNCPAGLLWNDADKICDWPWNAHCGRHADCRCGAMSGDFCGSRANQFSHPHQSVPLEGDGCLANAVYGCESENSPAIMKHYCANCDEHGQLGRDVCVNV